MSERYSLNAEVTSCVSPRSLSLKLTMIRLHEQLHLLEPTEKECFNKNLVVIPSIGNLNSELFVIEGEVFPLEQLGEVFPSNDLKVSSDFPRRISISTKM